MTNGTRALADIRADIDRWYRWYPQVVGIFLDEAPTGAGGDHRAQFAGACGYAHQRKPGALVVANPGVYPLTADYVDAADVVCVFEGDLDAQSYLTHTVPGYATYYGDYPPQRWLHLVYGVDDAATMRTCLGHARTLGAAWCHASDTAASSWSALAGYHTEQVTALRAVRLVVDPLDRARHAGAMPAHALSGAPGVIVPADHGWHAWTHDPAANVNQSTHTAGVLYGSRIEVRERTLAAAVVLFCTTAGSTLTAGECFVGLQDAAGDLVAESADQAAAWASTGVKTATLVGGPYQIDPGTYRVVLVANGSTPPRFAAASLFSVGVNAGLSAAETRHGSQLTGLTALPATVDPADWLQDANAPWAALA